MSVVALSGVVLEGAVVVGVGVGVVDGVVIEDGVVISVADVVEDVLRRLGAPGDSISSAHSGRWRRLD